MRLASVVVFASFVVALIAVAVRGDTGPAWVHTHSTPNAASMAGPTLTGLSGVAYPYVFASTVSTASGNTTIAVYDARKDGGPDQVAFEIASAEIAVARPLQGKALMDDFLITTKDTMAGTTNTYRWNPVYGREWTMARGIVADEDHNLAVDDWTGLVVLGVGTQIGTSEEIAGVLTDPSTHGTKIAWVKSLDIPQASQVSMMTYARDFIFLYSNVPTVAFVHFGTIYSIDTSTGSWGVQVSAPCGFTYDGFRIKAVRLGGSANYLVAYGNVPGVHVEGNGTKKPAYVVCVMTMTPDLTPLWNYTFNHTVTTSCHDCINGVSTAFTRGGIPFVQHTLFISGSEYMGMFTKNKQMLWAFDLDLGFRIWGKERLVTEYLSMPIYVGGKRGGGDDHVATSIGGQLVGLDPTNGDILYGCGVGCVNTPVNTRSLTTGALTRSVCVSNTYAFNLHAVDLGATDPNTGRPMCASVWNYTASDLVDLITQNTLGILAYTNAAAKGGEVEPFVTAALETGVVLTIAIRAANEPVPTPVPPPPPPPTLPPDTFPDPLKKVVVKPALGFSFIDAFSASIHTFNANGPIVAVIADADLDGVSSKDKKAPSTDAEVGVGPRYLSAYFLMADFSQGTVLEPSQFYFTQWPLGLYNYLRPIRNFYSSPAAGAATNGAACFYTSMTTGFFDLVTLCTASNEKGAVGKSETFGRYGASSMLAVDPVQAGVLYYTTGVVDGRENLNCIYNVGDGAKSVTLFSVQLQQFGFMRQFTSYTGDLVAIKSATWGSVVVFSRLNSLLFYAGSQHNGDFVISIPNPCGFAPSTNTAHNFTTMDGYAVGAAGDSALFVVDTQESQGVATFGLCLVDAAATTTTFGLLTDVALIQSVTSLDGWLAGSSVYVFIEYYDSGYSGTGVAYDKTGKKLWQIPRKASIGSSVLPIPGTSAIVTNADSNDNTLPAEFYGMALTQIDTTGGAATASFLAQCQFSCTMIAMLRDEQGRYVTLCPLMSFDNIVRAVRFDGGKCNIVWETDVGASVVAIQNKNYAGMTVTGVVGTMASIVTQSGYIVGVTADSAASTTTLPASTTVAPTPPPSPPTSTPAPTAAPAGTPAPGAPASTPAPSNGPAPTNAASTAAPGGDNKNGGGSANQNGTDDGGDKGGIGGGAAAAIVISVVLIAAVGGGFAYIYFRKRRRTVAGGGYAGIDADGHAAIQDSTAGREVRMSYGGTELSHTP
jgi:hypothetical protein